MTHQRGSRRMPGFICTVRGNVTDGVVGAVESSHGNSRHERAVR